jgi:urea transporter
MRSFAAMSRVSIDWVVRSMRPFPSACSSILFLSNSWVGILFFSVTLLHPSVAVLGFCAFLSGEAAMTAFALPNSDPVRNICRYNTLLIGFAVGHLFAVTPLSLFLTLGLAVFVVLLSFLLHRLLALNYGLPVLNIPFTIAALIAYLASMKYSALNTAIQPFARQLNIVGLPSLLSGLFQATGQIFFLPYDIPGLLILLAVLCASPILFFLSVTAWGSGTLVQTILKGSLHQASQDLSAFNFLLVGIAVGAVFMIPSRRAYLMAVAAVTVSVFVNDGVQVFCSLFQIPPFTISFNITALLFVFLCATLKHSRYNAVAYSTPEEAFRTFTIATRRFPLDIPEPHLPFNGEWAVYQGFNGPWTHVGEWRYAVDFVINDSAGKSFHGSGNQVQDYYCFDKPVCAPVSGIVVDLFDGLDDNPVGHPDRHNNWGNYCIIRSDFGYFIELSHLKKGSLKVAEGERVVIGAPVGMCGNSGNSSQPHLHCQVQHLGILGAATIRFAWGNACVAGAVVKDPALIPSGTKISPLSLSKKLTHIMQYALDDHCGYTVTRNGVPTGTCEVGVRLDPSGWYCLFDKKSQAQLYFGIRNTNFVFYSMTKPHSSPLRWLFLAAPVVPLFDDEALTWQEPLAEDLLTIKDWRSIPLIQSILGLAPSLVGRYQRKDGSVCDGTIKYGHKTVATTSVTLDGQRGIAAVTCTINGICWKMRLVE